MADVLTGKGYAITNSNAAALTAGGSETITIIGCTIANVHATDACWVTVTVNRTGGGVDTKLCYQISIPVNDSLDILQGKVVLNSSDAIEMQAQATSKLEASLSYLVQT